MSKKYVTIVYEIVDDDAWSNGGNPLHYAHHGLQAVCASVGDLAEARDELVETLETFLAYPMDRLLFRAEDIEAAEAMLARVKKGGTT